MSSNNSSTSSSTSTQVQIKATLIVSISTVRSEMSSNNASNPSSGYNSTPSSSSGSSYQIESSGTNGEGDHYCSRDYGPDVPNQNSYHYSNARVTEIHLDIFGSMLMRETQRRLVILQQPRWLHLLQLRRRLLQVHSPSGQLKSDHRIIIPDHTYSYGRLRSRGSTYASGEKYHRNGSGRLLRSNGISIRLSRKWFRA
jgi:hypothetical protein